MGKLFRRSVVRKDKVTNGDAVARQTSVLETKLSRRKHSSQPNHLAKFIGSLHHSYPPRELLHSRKIYQTTNEKNFNIDVELRTCVHGFFSPSMMQRASLLIFNVQLVCTGKRGTFNRALMHVDFEDIPGATTAKTAILAHAPYEFETRQRETEVKAKQSATVGYELSALVDLVGGVGGAKVKASNELTTSSLQKYFGKGSSGTYTNEDGRKSGIWWNVKKSSDPNAKDDAGIEANYRFAVLVTRESKAEFRVRLKLNVDVANMGLRHALRGGASKVVVTGESASLLIDPETHYEGYCDGISRMNLGRLLRKGRMAELASVA